MVDSEEIDLVSWKFLFCCSEIFGKIVIFVNMEDRLSVY